MRKEEVGEGEEEEDDEEEDDEDEEEDIYRGNKTLSPEGFDWHSSFSACQENLCAFQQTTK